MNDTDVQAPKIEFPCERYPIKVIGEAGDGFAQPINDAISGAIKFGLDSKANGGLELSGTDMIAGGAAGSQSSRRRCTGEAG